MKNRIKGAREPPTLSKGRLLLAKLMFQRNINVSKKDRSLGKMFIFDISEKITLIS